MAGGRKWPPAHLIARMDEHPDYYRGPEDEWDEREVIDTEEGDE